MKHIHLALGSPTGHHDQYSVTLVADERMLRGSLSVGDARGLADVLRQGCRATGREFTVALPKTKRGKHASTV